MLKAADVENVSNCCSKKQSSDPSETPCEKDCGCLSIAQNQLTQVPEFFTASQSIDQTEQNPAVVTPFTRPTGFALRTVPKFNVAPPPPVRILYGVFLI